MSPRHRHGDQASWFAALVREQLHERHRHVRLVYPYAPTEAVLLAAFQRALRRRFSQTHSPFVWLCALARQAVYEREIDPVRFRERNAAAVAFGIREVASTLEGGARTSAVAVVDALEMLPADDQDIIRLTSVEQFSPAELAVVLATDVEAAQALADDAAGRLQTMVRSLAERGRADDRE